MVGVVGEGSPEGRRREQAEITRNGALPPVGICPHRSARPPRGQDGVSPRSQFHPGGPHDIRRSGHICLECRGRANEGRGQHWASGWGRPDRGVHDPARRSGHEPARPAAPVQQLWPDRHRGLPGRLGAALPRPRPVRARVLPRALPVLVRGGELHLVPQSPLHVPQRRVLGAAAVAEVPRGQLDRRCSQLRDLCRADRDVTGGEATQCVGDLRDGLVLHKAMEPRRECVNRCQSGRQQHEDQLRDHQ